jgi:hypothetical protein
MTLNAIGRPRRPPAMSPSGSTWSSPWPWAVPGAILVGYRPTNPIGWILVAMGLTSGVSVVLGEYGYYALHTNPEAVPGGVLVLWLQTLVWFPPIGLVSLLVLLVPDGSLPSPRWRPLAWVAVAAMAVVIVAGALSPGPIGGDPLPGTPQNPLGMESAGQALDLAGDVGFLVTPTVALVALLALALRFRRARGWSASSSSGSPTELSCSGPGWRRSSCP